MTAQPVSARERSAFGQFQMGQSHIKTDLTKVRKQASVADMAEMLRDGVSPAEVAQAFGIAERTLQFRFQDSGWNSVTGKPSTKPTPEPEPAPPPPPREDLSWQQDGLCFQTDPEAFFPEKGGSTRDAKKVCAACNVAAECLTYALDHDERFGVWGGLIERERRQLKATRARARNKDTTTQGDTK